MDDKKFCFISCVNDEQLYEECMLYINNLIIPEGYKVEIVGIRESKSMTSGYNKAMESSDAKYKIYLHQDTFIINENFLLDIVYLFEKNEDIGMIGMTGCTDMPLNGIWWESKECYGNTYENHDGVLKEIGLKNVFKRFEEVKAIDGFIMITQYDIHWQEEAFDGWHFYDVSECAEFIKAGYKIAVPKQEKVWTVHDCGIIVGNYEDEYNKYRSIYLKKYKKQLEKWHDEIINEVILQKGIDKKLLNRYSYQVDNGVFVGKNYKYVNYLDGSEQYIYNVFKREKSISSYPTELAKYIIDWGSQYHLTHVRTNLLHSIESIMPIGGKALELGAGMGASTNWLADRFNTVHCIEGNLSRAVALKERNKSNNNVNVFVDDLNDEVFPEKDYDMITLLGVMEYLPFYSEDDPKNVCKKMMNKIKNNLSDDGIFVLAIENKLGAKYFAGCAEDHNARLFSGINGYPEKSPITFSKKELKKMLSESGFNNIEFYFPFPDYKLPTTVIRECDDVENFEIGGIVRANSLQYTGQREYLMMEPLLLNSLNEAGLLFDMANSFLIVCSKNEKVNLDTEYIIRKYWNGLGAKSHLHHYSDFKQKENDYIVEKHMMQKVVEVEGTSNDVLSLKIKDSKIAKGKNIVLEVYKTLLINDNYKKLITYCERLRSELIKQFATNKKDQENYNIVNGNAFDFVFNNIIEQDGKWVFIDRKWEAKTEFSEDFILYRSIKTIYIDMNPYIPMFSSEEFIVSILKAIYKNFTNERLGNLYSMEEECLKSIYPGYKVSDIKSGVFNKSIEIKKNMIEKMLASKKK